MENLDLDINNYSLKDILNLFNLSSDYDADDLKRARKWVLKTHPDKSNLDKEVFLFFTKAYNMMVKVFNFKNKTEKKVVNSEYTSSDIDHIERNEELLKKRLAGKSRDDFNGWFNKMFDKCHEDKETRGYGDWLKSNDDVMNIKAKNMNEFNRIFKSKKKETRELALQSNMNEKMYGTSSISSSMIDDNEQQVYSSDIFSKLKYEDLKKAHKETVVPVTEEDFYNKERFDNIDQYLRYREKNKAGVLGMEESKRILQQENMQNETVSTQRAYNMLMQDKQMNKRNNLWWKNLKLLE